jgi:hypothetical protein
MNNYRVGRWYPEDKRHKFLDGNGYFINPKSIVTTGAMIGYLASTKGSLDGFTLNLNEFAKKMQPTTEFFGKLNEDTMEFTQTMISPDDNRSNIEASSFPVRIGARQLNTKSYPSRPFYTLDFNLQKIEDRIAGRLDDTSDIRAIQKGVEDEIAKIKQKMPLKFTINREYIQDKEKLVIESVITNDGDELNTRFFKLQVQSMSEIDNFWLDSGIFSLKINN